MKLSLMTATAVLALTALPALPASAACTRPQSLCTVGPSIPCEQLLFDVGFEEWDASTCAKWVGSGWTSYHGSSGSDYFWEIQPWGGNVYQQFTVPSYTEAMDVTAVIYLIKNTPGTERITIELTNTSGTVLQSLGTYYASSSGSTISVSTATSLFPGQTVRLRARVTSGGAPGDTLFRVTQAYVRAYDLP